MKDKSRKNLQILHGLMKGLKWVRIKLCRKRRLVPPRKVKFKFLDTVRNFLKPVQ